MGDCCNTSKLDNPFHDDFNGMLYFYCSGHKYFVLIVFKFILIDHVNGHFLYFKYSFAEGGSDEFTDSHILNQCYRFDLHSDLAMRMTLLHEGW